MQIITQNKRLWIIGSAIIVIIGIAFGVFAFINRESALVTNYNECVAREYPLLETFPRQCKTPAGIIFTENIGNILEKTDLIRIESPKPNQEVNAAPLEIKGQARGMWFFEGSFPIEIRDNNGNLLASGIAQSQDDWMTEEFVPFIALIPIESNFQGEAELILRKDNPTGLPEFDDKLYFPIRLNITSEMMAVKVYFGLKTPTAGTDPCDMVYPISRSVLKTPGIARAAMEELLKGPTEAEVAGGYFTSLNDGVKLNRIAIVDGEAQVDFSSRLEEQVGGSCRVTAIRAQITETLKQFPSVNRVTISINGRVEDILQP